MSGRFCRATSLPPFHVALSSTCASVSWVAVSPKRLLKPSAIRSLDKSYQQSLHCLHRSLTARSRSLRAIPRSRDARAIVSGYQTMDLGSMQVKLRLDAK